MYHSNTTIRLLRARTHSALGSWERADKTLNFVHTDEPCSWRFADHERLKMNGSTNQMFQKAEKYFSNPYKLREKTSSSETGGRCLSFLTRIALCPVSIPKSDCDQLTWVQEEPRGDQISSHGFLQYLGLRGVAIIS